MIAAAASGCCGSAVDFLLRQPPGRVAPLTNGPKIELVGLARLKADNTFEAYVDLSRDNVGVPLGLGSALTLPGYVLHLRVTRHVDGTEKIYHILSGSHANGGEIIVTLGGVQIVAGWGYFIGSMPYGETTRTAAASDGTTFLLSAGLRGDGGVDQLALLKIPSRKQLKLIHADRSIADVTLDNGKEGHFVDVKATKFESAKAIAPDSPLDKLAKRANGLAAEVRAKHSGFPRE